MIRSSVTIAVAELKIAYRNQWVVTAVALMTLFGLILAFAGSAPAGTLGVDRLTLTVSSLATLCVYLVPLIALLLSYDGFAGEAERGSLPLLFTYPASRFALLAGKYLAQLVILAIAVFAGFGITAGVVWSVDGGSSDGFALLFRLQWSATLLGAGFLALGAALSAASRQTGTAASLAIAVWLLAVVMYDVGLLGAVVADDGGTFTKSVFPWLLLANPTDAFRLFVLQAVDATVPGTGPQAAVQMLDVPAFVPVAIMTAWVIVFLALALASLRRAEG